MKTGVCLLYSLVSANKWVGESQNRGKLGWHPKHRWNYLVRDYFSPSQRLFSQSILFQVCGFRTGSGGWKGSAPGRRACARFRLARQKQPVDPRSNGHVRNCSVFLVAGWNIVLLIFCRVRLFNVAFIKCSEFQIVYIDVQPTITVVD